MFDIAIGHRGLGRWVVATRDSRGRDMPRLWDKVGDYCAIFTSLKFMLGGHIPSDVYSVSFRGFYL